MFVLYITFKTFSCFSRRNRGIVHLPHFPESRNPHFLNWLPLGLTTEIPGKMRVESVKEIILYVMLTNLDHSTIQMSYCD